MLFVLLSLFGLCFWPAQLWMLSFLSFQYIWELLEVLLLPRFCLWPEVKNWLSLSSGKLCHRLLHSFAIEPSAQHSCLAGDFMYKSAFCFRMSIQSCWRLPKAKFPSNLAFLIINEWLCTDCCFDLERSQPRIPH